MCPRELASYPSGVLLLVVEARNPFAYVCVLLPLQHFCKWWSHWVLDVPTDLASLGLALETELHKLS